MAKDLGRYLEAEARLWRASGVVPTDRHVTLPGGGRVRVQEVGTGRPVVFLHGVSVAGTSWCHLVRHLDGVRCILVDRPGCGLSDPIVGGPLRDLRAVETYADRLLPDLLDALELDEATIACTSYGGLFAFRGAASAPHRVTALIAYSWVMGAPTEAAPLTARLAALPGAASIMMTVPMTRWMVKRALRQFGLRRAIDSGAFDDDMLDWVHALLRDTNTLANETRSSPKVVTPLRGQNDELLLGDELLAALTMPTLLLWGEHDPNAGAELGRAFASRLPNAELVVVEGAEHAPWIDDPETCASHTQRFLTG